MNGHWQHTKAALLSLENAIKCGICGNLPTDPHMLWCQHSYCKDCILKQTQCPECSYPMKGEDVVRNIMLSHLLNVMKVSSEFISSNPSCGKRIISKDTEKSNSIVNDEEIKNNKQILLEEVETKKNLKTGIEKKKVIPRNQIPSKLEHKNKKTISQDKINEKIKSVGSCLLTKSSMKPSTKSFHDTIPCTKITSINATPTNKKRRESFISHRKDSEQDEESSIKCFKDVFKTSKPLKKLSPRCSSAKSSILFSAKKIQPSNKVNVKGESPLQIACRKGRLELVQKLLDEGAEPNVKDYANWTPLCDAVGSGNAEVVKLLLEAGAGVNTPSNLNTTALIEAVVRKDTAIIRLLLSFGADINQRTTLDNTALSIADDELKVILETESKVPVQPYPRVTSSARTVLAVQLSSLHTNQLLTLCQKFNLSLSTVFTDDVSHIIVEINVDNVCQETTAVMIGMLSGCSVVGPDWVSACLKEDRLLPADNFEPSGFDDSPNTEVFRKARLNKEHLLPRLFDGCHISLQHDQSWPESLKHNLVELIQASGAVYQPRQCDAERILPSEQTVMFHASCDSPLSQVSHIILYQVGASEPLLKYNMAHVKSFSVTWFLQSIKKFTLLNLGEVVDRNKL